MLSAQFKSDNTVGFFAPSRQHQNWGRRIFFMPPYLPAYLKAIDARQHQVQQDEIRRVSPHLRNCKAAVCGVADAESFLFEVVLQQFDQVMFVFNNQNLLRHHDLREPHSHRPRASHLSELIV
jgi:hypothetical protein